MFAKQFMQLAIQLAKAAQGQTSPNPSVGAVLVKNNQVVGVGTHLFAGSEHAEIHAINMAGKLAKGATLYVTLEPCVHFGKTPPCTSSIINAGIKSVVIATLDVNPKVAGSGVIALRNAGINVEVGLLENEAKKINQAFFYYIEHKLPYITLKAGVSLDSKLATKTGESKWITNAKSRSDAYYLRHIHDAILVGIDTVLADNPSLTTKIEGGGRNPVRIILDTHLRIPLNAAVVIDEQSPTWIIVGSAVSQELMLPYLAYPKVQIIQLAQPIISLHELLAELGAREITSVLVEGGNKVLSSFIQAKLVNQLILYISPMLIGGASAPALFENDGFSSLAQALKLEFTETELLDGNLKIIAKVKNNDSVVD